MVTIDNHPAMPDPKHPDSNMCFRCHLPVQHRIHKEKNTAIKGTATPKKIG